MNRTPEEWKLYKTQQQRFFTVGRVDLGTLLFKAIEDIGTLAAQLAEAREVLQRLVDASTYEGLPSYQSVLLEAKVYLSRTEAKETIIDHRATPKYRTDGEVTG